MTGNSEKSGLSFRDNISLAWKAVDYEPDAQHLALVSESNEAFLKAVAAIGEPSPEVGEDSPGIWQEVARLDLKLNLLLNLVSQLVYSQLDVPDVTEVTVSGNGITWTADPAPTPGSVLFLEVYIQRGTPKPLCFYGRVVSDDKDLAAGVARVEYLGLSDATHGWLEKLIFRHHRRQVAFEKSVRSSGENGE